MSTWVPSSGGRDHDPKTINDALDRVTRSLGMARASELRAVFGRWSDLVGEHVAAHARPVSLRDGVLVVAVDEPVWATQLKWLEADLLKRLADVPGGESVTRLDVRVARPK